MIKSAFNASGAEDYNQNHVSEVFSLLITEKYVFAGVSPGHRDDPSNHYTGGMVRWEKPDPPNINDQNDWIIGGVNKSPNNTTSTTIAIGGIARDPSHPDTILAVTSRTGLRQDNASDLSYENGIRYKGEDNHYLTGLWFSGDGGENFDEYLSIDCPTGRRITTSVTDNRNSANLPRTLTLAQNHPNPFNPTTTITYELPQSSLVTLKVFDLLGQEVATLVDDVKPAGTYDVAFDAGSLAGGVYVYRLQAGKSVHTRKLLLLK